MQPVSMHGRWGLEWQIEWIVTEILQEINGKWKAKKGKVNKTIMRKNKKGVGKFSCIKSFLHPVSKTRVGGFVILFRLVDI